MGLKIEVKKDNRIEFFTRVDQRLLNRVRKKKKMYGHTWQEIVESALREYLNERKKGNKC